MTDWLSVPTWPRWARRSFVLTLPLSGPLYLLCAAAACLGMLVAVIVLSPIAGIATLWEGDESTNRLREIRGEDRQRK